MYTGGRFTFPHTLAVMDDETAFSYGDDSTPLFSLVEESAPSHWGKVTSTGRTCSAAYLKFLGKEEEKDVPKTPNAG